MRSAVVAALVAGALLLLASVALGHDLFLKLDALTTSTVDARASRTPYALRRRCRWVMDGASGSAWLLGNLRKSWPRKTRTRSSLARRCACDASWRGARWPTRWSCGVVS